MDKRNEYYNTITLFRKRSRVKNNGDYYFSISGSFTEGRMVSYYRKIGFDSVTTEHKVITLTNEELVSFLSDKDNLIRDKK